MWDIGATRGVRPRSEGRRVATSSQPDWLHLKTRTTANAYEWGGGDVSTESWSGVFEER